MQRHSAEPDELMQAILKSMPVPVPVLLMVRALGAGGTERQMTETARFLDRSRFAPHVCCLVPDGFRKAEIEQAGVPLFTLRVPSFVRPSVVRGAWQLASLIRRRRIAIVHTFDVPMNLFGTLPARLAGTPVVLSSQRAHRELTPATGRWLLRMVDHIVDGVVVNCNAMRDHVARDEGVSADRIFVCHNGIDTDLYHAGARDRSVFPNARLVIGVVCVLRREKGLDTLLEGFARICRLMPDLQLVLVGSGPEEEGLRRRAAELGIGDCCHFEPGTRDVASWLRRIDIFVLPSLSEALSNSLMEAMACGCCPVASRVGGNPELVSPDRTGLLFEAGNAEDLAAQLRVLVENEELRRRYAEASASRIATEFTPQAAARRMGEIYEANLRRKMSDSRATLDDSR